MGEHLTILLLSNVPENWNPKCRKIYSHITEKFMAKMPKNEL